VENATWGPDGRTLLGQVGSLGRSGLYRIDTRTWRATRLGDEAAVLFGPPGRLTVITRRARRGFDELWIADPDVSNRELVASTRGSFSGVVWSPDGSRLAVAVLFGDDDTSRLVVLDADARDAEIGPTSGVSGRHPVWSPDGRRIAFVRGRLPTDDVWVMDTVGKAVRQLTRTEAPELPLAWLPAR
jgi:Tol biopolymer transport system component